MVAMADRVTALEQFAEEAKQRLDSLEEVDRHIVRSLEKMVELGQRQLEFLGSMASVLTEVQADLAELKAGQEALRAEQQTMINQMDSLERTLTNQFSEIQLDLSIIKGMFGQEPEETAEAA